MKTTVATLPAGDADFAGFARFFDIVNGFFNRCRGGMDLWFGRKVDAMSLCHHKQDH